MRVKIISLLVALAIAIILIGLFLAKIRRQAVPLPQPSPEPQVEVAPEAQIMLLEPQARAITVIREPKKERQPAQPVIIDSPETQKKGAVPLPEQPERAEPEAGGGVSEPEPAQAEPPGIKEINKRPPPERMKEIQEKGSILF